MHVPPRLDLGAGLIAEPSSYVQHGEAFLALVTRNRQHIGRYLWRAAEVTTSARVAAHFADVQRQCQQGSMLEWMLVFDGSLCGNFRLNYIEPENRKAAVGYLLDADHQGRGLMTRAVRGIVTYAFEQLNFNRIELRHAVGNHASQRVAEKAGFRLEGILRQADLVDGQLTDLLIYGLLREDWLAASSVAG